MFNNVFFSSLRSDWTTPRKLFFDLNQKYNFDIDLCASDFNALCKEYYTIDNSCFNVCCHNKKIFCNPPYSRDMYKFIEKCYSLYLDNNLVVMLLPVRTDTKWFHDFIYHKADIEFIKGRLKFGGSKNSAPFPSMICILNPFKEVK